MLTALTEIQRDPAVADVLVRAGHLAQALDVLRLSGPDLPVGLDEFMEHVTSWTQALEDVEPGLAERVLLAVSSILGWVRAD